MHFTRLSIFLLWIVGVIGGLLGLRHLVYTGVIPRPSILKTLVPLKAEEITAQVLSTGNVAAKPIPSSSVLQPCVNGNTSGCAGMAKQEIEVWAWNANMGLIYGVGGKQTTKGSLAAAHNVSIRLKREDDTGNMKRDLLDTAQRLMSDPNAPGTKFVTIMGDAGAQFFAELNPKLAKVCADCTAKTVGIVGYSRGEDQFMGPAAWKADPQKMRGGVVVGVVGDGDWNIAMKYAAQNDIPNNPDESVYDPKALNWINSDSYTKAANDFATGQACYNVPTKGVFIKREGDYPRRCADGLVTWTPGDVTAAKKRGGVVTLLSTQQSVFQMPAILVGINRWAKAHPEDVQNILATAFDGANQIRSVPAALSKAGDISAEVYGEETGAYWVKYFRGVTEPDATGVPIHLGGSSVANFADNIQAFGLNGGRSLFAATYETFGKIFAQQYPELMQTFPPVSEVVDTSYLKALRGTIEEVPAEQVVRSDGPKVMSSIAGRRDYNIQFATGSADILPSSFATLDQLADEIRLTNYIVALHGHTDNARWAGLNEQSEDRNMELSKNRADAVQRYLVQKGLQNAIMVYPHGQDQPLAPNDTAEGRARNRRVTVVLGE